MDASRFLAELLISSIGRSEALKLLTKTLETILDEASYDEETRPQEDRIQKAQPQQYSEGSGKIILSPGDVLSCHKCKRDIYKITKPVRSQGVSVDYFRSAFQSLGNWPGLPPQIDILKYEGGLLIDCPACKTKHSIAIIQPKSFPQDDGADDTLIGDGVIVGSAPPDFDK